MDYLHTYIQLRQDNEVIFSTDDVILPIVAGDKIQINKLWYKVIDITYHCDKVTPCSRSISKIIWVMHREK